ncbi:hypothetical protein BC831DRAFT_454002 [Entophlyctis helioformis]|nr:hypothetical protein BC831DRAFT_454002 [Entophlyctis helioformis]
MQPAHHAVAAVGRCLVHDLGREPRVLAVPVHKLQQVQSPLCHHAQDGRRRDGVRALTDQPLEEWRCASLTHGALDRLGCDRVDPRLAQPLDHWNVRVGDGHVHGLGRKVRVRRRAHDLEQIQPANRRHKDNRLRTASFVAVLDQPHRSLGVMVCDCRHECFRRASLAAVLVQPLERAQVAASRTVVHYVCRPKHINLGVLMQPDEGLVAGVVCLLEFASDGTELQQELGNVQRIYVQRKVHGRADPSPALAVIALTVKDFVSVEVDRLLVEHEGAQQLDTVALDAGTAEKDRVSVHVEQIEPPVADSNAQEHRPRLR